MKYLILVILLLSCVREPLAPKQADEDLYQQGMQSLSDGDYTTARSTFREFRRDYPSSDRLDNAILAQAEAEQSMGFGDSAVWTLKEMPSGSSLYGESLLRQGTYMLNDATKWPADSAVSSFRKTIRWDGDVSITGEAWYSLGQSFYKMVGTASVPRPSYYDSALIAFSHIRSYYSSHIRYPDALYRIGWIHYQKSSWIPAGDSLSSFAETYPNHSNAEGALYWAAKAYGNANRFCLASTTMNQLLSLHPYSDYRASAQSEIAGWSCEP